MLHDSGHKWKVGLQKRQVRQTMSQGKTSQLLQKQLWRKSHICKASSNTSILHEVRTRKLCKKYLVFKLIVLMNSRCKCSALLLLVNPRCKCSTLLLLVLFQFSTIDNNNNNKVRNQNGIKSL